MAFPAFPDGFLWGVSSSAYQIEGAVDVDGRGPSIWDSFAAEPGRIVGGDTAATANDHYNRYREDVGLLGELGVGAYRFSVSWPRVVPDGSGEINKAGLDFYDRLVDELCANDIAPAATLFHWDLPQRLEDDGGWLNRDTTQRFADYATIVAERLGDRVRMWLPVNEPMIVTIFGYAVGTHAPGKELMFEALPVAHHLLLAHGLGTQALRAAGATNIGIANYHVPVWPASDCPRDQGAAALYDRLVNDLFAAPVLTGRYPTDELAIAMPGPVAEDLAVIATPLDWYGVNYYLPNKVAAPSASSGPTLVDGTTIPEGLPFDFPMIDGYPLTDIGWPVVPSGLSETLTTLVEKYPDLPPVYITGSGCVYHDEVHDKGRIDYLDGHLRVLREAIDGGIDVRGYFVWSIVDNFGWDAGYSQRFGLVHVDRDTLARSPKDSFYWYRDMIRAQQ
jgi:beta-glucosidase